MVVGCLKLQASDKILVHNSNTWERFKEILQRLKILDQILAATEALCLALTPISVDKAYLSSSFCEGI